MIRTSRIGIAALDRQGDVRWLAGSIEVRDCIMTGLLRLFNGGIVVSSPLREGVDATSRREAQQLIDELPIRSDHLKNVRQVLETYPVLAVHLARPEEARLVIDANVAISEVRWLATKRKDPRVRTALQEAIASGTGLANRGPRFDRV